MKSLSLWSNSSREHGFEPLHKNIKTDVLIIGAGAVGLLCAYKLQEAGVDCTLVEADRICAGVTRNTTAKITAQHGLIYHKLIKRFGAESAKKYFLANAAAIEDYRKICEAENIDCELEEKSALTYSLHDAKKIEKELTALSRIRAGASFSRADELPFSVAGAVELRGQAQFHPLKFFYAISDGLNIFEHTKVRELSKNCAITDRGVISFDKVIVATHFPIINKHGAYFLKMYQHRSYVLALDGAPRIDSMLVDDDEQGMSFRSSGDLLLIGGGGHRTGESGGGWRELEAFAKRHYPKAEIKYKWAAQDCITLDDVAYIGQYSRSTPNMYVATGFNKWGMTSSMVAANILRDMILRRHNDYADVFSPTRSILRPRLAVHAAKTVVNLLTPTTPRCPHLGCALKYNKAEHSWDCPCHGSRFTENFELIDNPATDDKKT